MDHVIEKRRGKSTAQPHRFMPFQPCTLLQPPASIQSLVSHTCSAFEPHRISCLNLSRSLAKTVCSGILLLLLLTTTFVYFLLVSCPSLFIVSLTLTTTDGGGVRGLSSLYILQKLMQRINPESPPKPCDYFDLICGISTGGYSIPPVH
jgi:Patatin-like phospholipase